MATVYTNAINIDWGMWSYIAKKVLVSGAQINNFRDFVFHSALKFPYVIIMKGSMCIQRDFDTHLLSLEVAFYFVCKYEGNYQVDPLVSKCLQSV